MTFFLRIDSVLPCHIKSSEIFQPAPVFDINQRLKRFTKIVCSDAEYSVPIDNCRSGSSDYRRDVSGYAAGTYFAGDNRGLSQITNFGAILPAVSSVTRPFFVTYHAHYHRKARVTVQNCPTAGYLKNRAVSNQLAGGGDADR